MAFGAVCVVPVVSAGPVHEPARVEDRAWRVDPPDDVADPAGHLRTETLDAINEVRVAGSMPELQLHDRVTAAAQAHADYLASIRSLSHAGPGGTDTGFRLQQAGFAWVAWGENVGAGFRDPELLVDRWVDSSAHHAQLVGEYRYAGIGVAASPDGVPYWVLVLAT